MTGLGIPGFAGAGGEPVASHLVGYRTWRLGGVDQKVILRPSGELWSTFIDHPWQAGVNEARCFRHQMFATPLPLPHGVCPDQYCGCGFWAYTAPPGDKAAFRGVIHGWGKMVCGPLGFRCQYARIVALSWWEADEHPAMVAAIRRRYPDAEWFGKAELHMRATYPASDLSALVAPGEAAS